ncbi:hypothetical protein QTH14_13360 [Clostridium perfringens]|uniref:Rhoptry protein n=2 Tax=Clostridium perfringens TaxID=1502 RepID=A0AB37C2U8_CLOPF|nr:hypothetical protein [Clostridium perfringens]ASY52613.1 hypothetical protein BG908_13460 [Clostridium perfringens]AWS24192.1 hypothetical protein CYK96_00570 [Clostridium perfringens]EGT0681371.1 hypothetical protein [Clostridium perfringens]EJT6477386.1 hypothetical protein [Clostridium perfringens]MDK0869999.1 hypothetical protein [Clostridium perfringens]
MQNFSNPKDSNVKKTLEFLHKNDSIKNDYLKCKNPKSRIDFLKNCKGLNIESITQYLTNEVRKELLRDTYLESKVDAEEQKENSMETNNCELESNCEKNKDDISSLQHSFFDKDSSKSNKSDEIKLDTLSNEKLIDSSEPKEITLIGSETINYQKEIDRLSDSLTKLRKENSELKEFLNSFTNLNNKTTDISSENENSLESDSLKEIKQIASLRSLSSQKTDISISTDLLRKVTLLFVENKIIDPNSLAIENINPYSLITETIILKFINQNSFL